MRPSLHSAFNTVYTSFGIHSGVHPHPHFVQSWPILRVHACVCVSICVCVYLHGMPRADIVHVVYMPRADFRQRADAFYVRCWFWLQFGTRHT